MGTPPQEIEVQLDTDTGYLAVAASKLFCTEFL